jgi:hypothetical protein
MADPPLTWAFACPNPTCDTELVILPEQAGQAVECPTCGFRFEAPRVVSPKLATRVRKEEREALLREKVQAADRNRKGDGRAADALDALARRTGGSERPPVGSRSVEAGRVGRRPADPPADGAPLPVRSRKPPGNVGEREGKPQEGRRKALRADLMAPPRPRDADESPAKGPWAGVLLVWLVAIVAAGAVVVASVALETPDLALVSGLFVALAIVRTVLALRRREGSPNVENGRRRG